MHLNHWKTVKPHLFGRSSNMLLNVSALGLSCCVSFPVLPENCFFQM